ncbi:hypothetical protein BT67DRAFT_37244 [Trichocladium antarcticum]|uniref:Uncharacterized protein n=1 Tax=Trichocladium antarcticum TaxID=1450529 RepID=A0AAN6ULN1_9PEZI|nr:hypothetical protein BT67DRAFT_37244 [Trichocladium antarcticum]
MAMVVWCGEMEKEEKTREGRQKGKAGQRSRVTGARLSQPISARQCASGSQLSCGAASPGSELDPAQPALPDPCHNANLEMDDADEMQKARRQARREAERDRGWPFETGWRTWKSAGYRTDQQTQLSGSCWDRRMVLQRCPGQTLSRLILDLILVSRFYSVDNG